MQDLLSEIWNGDIQERIQPLELNHLTIMVQSLNNNVLNTNRLLIAC